MIHFLEHFADWLAQRIRRRVMWLADGLVALSAVESKLRPWIVIVGRQAVDIKNEFLPIRGWIDAKQAAELIRRDELWTLAIVGRWDGERRPVTYYRIDDRAMQLIDKSFFWLFEDDLLRRSMERNDIVAVNRYGFRYFLTGSGASQPAGSLITDPSIFALSMGFGESGITPGTIDESECGRRFAKAILRVSIDRWVQSLNPSVWGRLLRSARVTLAASAVLVFFYCFFSIGYLFGLKEYRKYQLAALGSEVGGLLERQREIDVKIVDVNAIASVVNSNPDSYVAWSLVSSVWDAGGSLTGLSLKDGRFIVRGLASDATAILSGISSKDGISAAKFESPVRDIGGRQDFSIGVNIVAGVSR
jgi:hypothetical protein